MVTVFVASATSFSDNFRCFEETVDGSFSVFDALAHETIKR